MEYNKYIELEHKMLDNTPLNLRTDPKSAADIERYYQQMKEAILNEYFKQQSNSIRNMQNNEYL